MWPSFRVSPATFNPAQGPPLELRSQPGAPPLRPDDVAEMEAALLCEGPISPTAPLPASLMPGGGGGGVQGRGPRDTTPLPRGCGRGQLTRLGYTQVRTSACVRVRAYVCVCVGVCVCTHPAQSGRLAGCVFAHWWCESIYMHRKPCTRRSFLHLPLLQGAHGRPTRPQSRDAISPLAHTGGGSGPLAAQSLWRHHSRPGATPGKRQ